MPSVLDKYNEMFTRKKKAADIVTPLKTRILEEYDDGEYELDDGRTAKIGTVEGDYPSIKKMKELIVDKLFDGDEAKYKKACYEHRKYRRIYLPSPKEEEEEPSEIEEEEASKKKTKITTTRTVEEDL